MKRADLSTAEVLAAVRDHHPSAFTVLTEQYPAKIVLAALEREARRGNIEYGVSLETAWITEQGRALDNAPTDDMVTVQLSFGRYTRQRPGETPSQAMNRLTDG